MGDDPAAYIEQLDPLDAVSTIATKWNTAWSRYPNPQDPSRYNHVYIMGWNKNPGGGPENANDDAFGLHFEQYWCNAPGHGLFEFHFDWWQRRTLSTIRPFSMGLDRSDGTIDISWTSHKINFFDARNHGPAQWLIFTPNQLMFIGTTRIAHQTNNAPVITQINAARTFFLNVIYADSSDRVVVGDARNGQMKVGQGKADLYGCVYAVAGKQVVGPRLPAIANRVTLDDVIANQVAILDAMRAHGLIEA